MFVGISSIDINIFNIPSTNQGKTSKYAENRHKLSDCALTLHKYFYNPVINIDNDIFRKFLIDIDIFKNDPSRMCNMQYVDTGQGSQAT